MTTLSWLLAMSCVTFAQKTGQTWSLLLYTALAETCASWPWSAVATRQVAVYCNEVLLRLAGQQMPVEWHLLWSCCIS